MALASKVNVDDNDVTHTNNLLVVGGASFVDENLVGTSIYNNAEFFVNAVNKMCGKETTIAIFEEKSFEASPLSITSAQVSAMKWVVIVGIPALVAVCGVVVFIRRRNR